MHHQNCFDVFMAIVTAVMLLVPFLHLVLFQLTWSVLIYAVNLDVAFICLQTTSGHMQLISKVVITQMCHT
jgi:hypothetical protein